MHADRWRGGEENDWMRMWRRHAGRRGEKDIQMRRGGASEEAIADAVDSICGMRCSIRNHI